MACGSRLGSVIAHEAQQRPTLTVLQGTPDVVAEDLRTKLVARPTVAFLQYSETPGERPSDRAAAMLAFVRRRLPPETQVLGAQTDNWQCLAHRNNTPKGKSTKTDLDHFCLLQRDVVRGGRKEACREIALLVATLPEATARAYHIKAAALGTSDSEESSSDDVGSDYGESDDAEAGEADSPTAQLQQDIEAEVKDAEAALSSALAMQETPAEAKAPVEQEAEAKVQDSEWAELLNLDPAPEVIVLNVACKNGKCIKHLQSKYPNAAIIGGVVMGGQVLASSGTRGSTGAGIGALALFGNAPLFALTSPYRGSVPLAQADVARKLRWSRDQGVTQGRHVLGALLYTCIARDGSMFHREAVDARLFQEEFPEAPLLGSYSGGEVGPKVDSESEEEEEVELKNAFLRGNAQIQGFTAVFGVFLVPSRSAPSALFQRAVLHGDVDEAFRELRAGISEK
eukprot:TRINITY_DN38223_c0_g1_i1.p1 TRINITY_DN38223_c0_g1~~TRINITY_DN38223_c0_g1_i1.p1  ORF type:complete len:506 (-),score=108.36 TRINITY_DN38223_c0_g1_i1:59-1423(-)